MSRSKHRTVRAIEDCDHGADPELCTTCARRYLYDAVNRLDRAVTAQRASAVRDVFVTGGAANWEPIDLAAMSLMQDLDCVDVLSDLTDGRLLHYRDRARIILNEAFAPFPAMREDTEPDGQGVRRTRQVDCPHCTGGLLLEREADPASPHYARVQLVRCNQNRSHAWRYNDGGFLRLRAALAA